MLIHLRDEQFQVNDDVAGDLVQLIMAKAFDIYDGLPPEIQVAADGYARAYLYKLETKLREKGYSAEEAMKLRPQKNEDPSVKVMQIMMSNIVKALSYVDIELELDEEGKTVKALSYGMSVPDGLQQTHL